MTDNKIPNEDEFLAELAELSKKYGIVIGACGCCDSPWLVPLSEVRKYSDTIPDWKLFNLTLDQVDPIEPFTGDA